MPGKRKLSKRVREGVITLTCRILSRAFDLPARLLSRHDPDLADLPPGSRVVFIKPCCLGDVLLATATIETVSRSFPALRLDFVVGEWSRPALQGNPRLDRLIPTGTTGSRLTWRQYLTLALRLRREHYAAALVLDRSPRLNLLPWLAGIPLRAGVDNRWRGFALNRRATQPPGLRHEASVYLAVAHVAGADITAARLEFYPGAEDVVFIEQYATRAGLDLDRPFAVIHPGGGQNPDTKVLSKRWPPARFGRITARLLHKGWQVVIIGATSDCPLATEVIATACAEFGFSAGLINACGELNLGQSGALLSRADLFIGNDTGFMHLAVACGAAVIAVFGPSSPVAYGPFMQPGRAVAPLHPNALSGLPLEEYQALSVAAGGIESVTVERVWQAVEEVLGTAGNKTKAL